MSKRRRLGRNLQLVKSTKNRENMNTEYRKEEAKYEGNMSIIRTNSLPDEIASLAHILTLSQKELFDKISDMPSTALIQEDAAIIVDPTPDTDYVYRPMICVHLDTVSRKQPTKSDILISGTKISLISERKVSYNYNSRISEYSPYSQTNQGNFVRGNLSSERGKHFDFTQHQLPQIRCLGGDDRCGVWIALRLILAQPKTPFIYGFFCDEECGGLGSSKFGKTSIFDFDTISCFVGIDRRNKHNKLEYATYGYDNAELTKVLDANLPSYKSVRGTFSDCTFLASQHSRACFNVCAGYEHEHTTSEVIYFDDVLTILNDMYNLEIPDAKYEAVKPVYKYSGYNSYQQYHDFDGDDAWMAEYYRSTQYPQSYSRATGLELDTETLTEVDEEFFDVEGTELLAIRKHTCELCGEHSELYEVTTEWGEELTLCAMCTEALKAN